MTRKSRTLTAEQETARDARRAKFSELARQVAAMNEAEQAAMAERMAGAITIEGRQLSMHNACLIACQNPTATILGGFQQWRQHGRVVRKGEHGLMIWAPVKARTDNSTTSETATADDSQRSRNFIMVTVFDVSQTEELDGKLHSAEYRPRALAPSENESGVRVADRQSGD